MVMTVNPAANAHTAAPFRDEAVYAFRFDTDGDRCEDVSFKARFGDVVHIPSRGSDFDHAQRFEVRAPITLPTALTETSGRRPDQRGRVRGERRARIRRNRQRSLRR